MVKYSAAKRDRRDVEKLGQNVCAMSSMRDICTQTQTYVVCIHTIQLNMLHTQHEKPQTTAFMCARILWSLATAIKIKVNNHVEDVHTHKHTREKH